METIYLGNREEIYRITGFADTDLEVQATELPGTIAPLAGQQKNLKRKKKGTK